LDLHGDNFDLKLQITSNECVSKVQGEEVEEGHQNLIQIPGVEPA
jgi:hypothetical protein